MKIKVKFIGEYFPSDIKDTIQTVEIDNIRLDNGVTWSTSSGYEVEAVEAEAEKSSDRKIDFGDNKLKTLTVEFK